MRPTEILREEHEHIKELLKVLENVSSRMESGEKIDEKDLEEILKFIRIFADRCHHGKEEDVLFPAMEKAGIPREIGPIAVMLAEHEDGRRFVSNMAEAVEGYRRGEESSQSRFVENARNYVVLLAQHIDKENNILYPMAEAHIPEREKDYLIEEFERIERERIGRGMHHELLETLEMLKRKYLS